MTCSEWRFVLYLAQAVPDCSTCVAKRTYLPRNSILLLLRGKRCLVRRSPLRWSKAERCRGTHRNTEQRQTTAQKYIYISGTNPLKSKKKNKHKTQEHKTTKFVPLIEKK